MELPTRDWIVPQQELRDRLGRLQARMERDGLDAILVGQNADFIYLAGSVANGWLLVPAAGEPTLHLRRAVERTRLETGWHDLRTTVSTRDLAAALRAAGLERATIGLELDVLPAAEAGKLQAALPQATWQDATPSVRAVRATKSEWELRWVHAAAAQVVEAMQVVEHEFRIGMTELDVMLMAERVLREQGHQGPVRMRRFNGEMFFGQVVSGPNAALASWLDSPLGGAGRYPAVGKGAAPRRIQQGELLVLDLMGGCNGYLSDCTRVFAVGGIDAVDPALVEAQHWCEATLEQVAAAAIPGARPCDLYEQALQLAADAGVEAQFMGVAPDQARFVGHGIGLEVDEYPFLAAGFEDPLEPGMVFALEPKLVFPGVAAVGIEDAFVVTEEGARPLSAVPRGLRAIG